MNLSRKLNSYDIRRLRIIHESGPLELLNAKHSRVKFACKVSVIRYVNQMRSRGLLQGDVEDMNIELTDEGERKIGD